MNYRIIGAIMVIAASSAMGFSVAAAQKREEAALKQLIRALEFMACELEYRMPPLPGLCAMTAMQVTGSVRLLFQQLQAQLDRQIDGDPSYCMTAALKQIPNLPEMAVRNLQLLGKSLGRFDLQGQLSGIMSVSELCKRDLQGLQSNQDVRFRTYRTLGICAGIALVILFI